MDRDPASLQQNYTIHHISIRGRRNADILLHVRNALERADMHQHREQMLSTQAQSSQAPDDACVSRSETDDAADKNAQNGQKTNDN